MMAKWLWMVVTLVLVNEWYHHHCCYGCLEQERIALLHLKASFNYPNGNSLSFQDWVDNKDQYADCCTWFGVECNTNTKRVIKLDLYYARDWSLEVYWYLNTSLFLPFQELKRLVLFDNKFAGCTENQGFGVLSSLKNLEYLDLSYNHFNDSILSGLSRLSSLKYLYLRDNRLTGLVYMNGFGVLSRLRNLKELHIGGNDLNDNSLSSLSGLSSLKSLDLSSINLTGSINISGFGVLSRLKNLEKLDISGNNLNDSSLSCLSGFSSLKSLDLSYNDLTGSVNISGLRNLKLLRLDGVRFNKSILLQSLGALPCLKTLSAMYSNFETQVTSQEFYNLTNLEELFLNRAYLPADFLQSIGALSALKVLSLSACNLSGTLPPKGWCELKNLEELYLIANDLEGLLPLCLGNLSSLRILDITWNRLTGNIASSPLANLASLEYLSLSSNHFQVPVSFKSFMNHSNLKFIACDNNKLIADPTFQTFTPKFQLQYFSLLNCASKALNAKFPNFLYSQHDLIVLDLSHNNFSGMFPSWLLENNTRLETLYLGENSFIGPLELPHHPNSNLSTLDVSANNIHGQIPRNMCLVFPQLSYLMMANNGLTGRIPQCFGNLSSLEILDLSNNQLSRGIPEKLINNHLWYVKLSNNNLDGQISPSAFNSSSSLEFLYLNGNNFTGQLLDNSWNRSSPLRILDVSDNQLSGMLPTWTGNMPFLSIIDVSRNHFEGPISAELCGLRSLHFLDLSENNLSGSISFCLNRTQISHIHLYKNRLSGPLTNAFCNSSDLVTLDLRDNNLIGPLPDWIGRLQSLRVLLLRGNHFDGGLPVQLCLLKQLSILDLSKNNFSGPLPSCLSNFTFEASTGKALFEYGFGSVESMSSLYLKRATLVQEGVDFQYYFKLFPYNSVENVVQFTTKGNSYPYKGDILRFMSGVDLSCNRFSGKIPSELGNLSEIRALNLSHNNLSGFIPTTFSNLKQIESLDLSYNNLNGEIPPELIKLNTLEVFSVAYNNLSGKTPERKAQFGTFEESSYEGNPLLCGPPLDNNCSELESPSPPVPNDSNGEREDASFIDMDAFFVTFGVSYIIVLLAIATILYINPYWRRTWFYFIEVFIDNCYYFVLDHFHKLCIFR